MFTYQSNQTIRIKYKIMLRYLSITYQSMHTPYLHSSNNHEWLFNFYNKNQSLQENGTWKVEWMTYKFGYILHRSCWPSFVRMCWTIKSTATWLSPPRGIIISAYFFVGRIKSSKAGFTNFEYCKKCNIRISCQNPFSWRNQPSKSDKENVSLTKNHNLPKINT